MESDVHSRAQIISESFIKFKCLYLISKIQHIGILLLTEKIILQHTWQSAIQLTNLPEMFPFPFNETITDDEAIVQELRF